MNLKMSRGLPAVAGLACAGIPADSIVEGVREAYDALKGKAGFGGLELCGEDRMLYAMASCLACRSAGETAVNMALDIIIQEITVTSMTLISDERKAVSTVTRN